MAAVIDAIYSNEWFPMMAWETTFGSAVTADTEIGLMRAYTPNYTFGDEMFIGTGQWASLIQWRNNEVFDLTLETYLQGGHAFGAMLYNDATGTADNDVDGAAAGDTLYTYSMTSSGAFLSYPSPFSLDVAHEEGATDAIDRYTSCFCRSADLTIPANGPWVLSMSCGAENMTPTAAAQETFVQPTDEPMLGSKTAITLASNPITNIEQAVLHLDERIRDAITLNSTKSMTDVHREAFANGITLDLTAIEIDREDYFENFVNETEVGDIVIKWDDSAATKHRQAKITLQDCRVMSCSAPIGMDNTIIIDTLTVQPTWDGTNDPLQIKYSTKTSGGFTGW